MAERQGYRLSKSRRRDPHALDYGRYHIFDLWLGTIVAGGHTRDDYALTLDDAEAWLTTRKKGQLSDNT